MEKNEFSIEREKRQISGGEFFDLTVSNPTQCDFLSLQNGLVNELAKEQNVFYHPESKGLQEAREAVVGYYQEKGRVVSENDIFLVASSSEAYCYLFWLLADPGDTILVPTPGYPLFEYIADLCDVRLETYLLSYFQTWHIEIPQRAFESPAKAVVIVNPNNPTGNYVSKTEQKEFLNYASKNEGAIIIDEVFVDYAYEEKNRLFIPNEEVLSFTISGLSKVLCMPQMKLSWIVVNGPDEVKERAKEKLEVICDTFLSVNTPSQNALFSWFSKRGLIQSEIRNRVLENRRYLEQTLHEGTVEVLVAEGGWNAILRFDSKHNDELLSLYLLQDKGVFVHPGYFFDLPECHLVISLLPPHENFCKGVMRLKAFISELEDRSNRAF